MAEENHVCQFVGEPMSDIAGVGILVGFAGQALLSLCLSLWVFFLSRHGRLDKALHEEDSDELAIETKRLEMIQDMLMIGNDIQMMTGIALMITAFTSSRRIDVYHTHLIFDTVSFVGVSNAAALVCYTFCQARTKKYHQRREDRVAGEVDFEEGSRNSATKTLQPFWKRLLRDLLLLVEPSLKNPIVKKFHLNGRYRVTYAFSASYLALTVMLDQQLIDWGWDVKGRCYHTRLTTAPDAPHPQADRNYVWITCAWLLVVMLWAVFSQARHRHWILAGAFLQLPVHFYMMLALRTSNQGRLGVTAEEAEAENESASEASENEWDFGQTTALLLLGVSIGEFYTKGMEFYRFERKLKRRRLRAEELEQQQDQGGNQQLLPS